MMKQTQITLDGVLYKLEGMPADDQALFGMQVLQVAGGSISKVLESGLDIMSFAEQNKDEEVGSDKILEVAKTVLGVLPSLNMTMVSALFKQALDCIKCNDGDLSDDCARELHFQKKQGNYYPVAIWASWELSKGFLLGAVPGLQRVFFQNLPAAASKSQSPQSKNSVGSLPDSTNEECAPIPILKPNR